MRLIEIFIIYVLNFQIHPISFSTKDLETLVYKDIKFVLKIKRLVLSKFISDFRPEFENNREITHRKCNHLKVITIKTQIK